MNGRQFDLNLFNIFDALMKERHVSRAAEKVGLSQPAMSHALRRLREMLNDQILVRNGSRMEPTQTALRLAPKVRNILAESFELVRGEQVFQPSSCERTFRIGMTDYVSSVILPKLTAEIYRLAPRAKLVVRQVGRSNGPQAVMSGEVDIGIGTFVHTDGLFTKKLFEESYKCAVWKKNLRVKQRLTLEDYLALPHMLVQSSSQSTGAVDFELAKLKLRRNIACVVPHYSGAPRILQQTDLILTLSEGALRQHAKACELRIIEPPLSLPPYRIEMLWDARTNSDEALIWVRKMISDISRQRAATTSTSPGELRRHPKPASGKRATA